MAPLLQSKPVHTGSKEKQSPFVGQFRKTKLCRFNETGRCRYGRDCPFAHSAAELEELPDLSKTSMCKNWLQGCCSASSEHCPFAHGKEELRKTPLAGTRKSAGKSSRGKCFPSELGEGFGMLDLSFEGSTMVSYDEVRGAASTTSDWSGSDKQNSAGEWSTPLQEEEEHALPLAWDPLGISGFTYQDAPTMHWVFPEFSEFTMQMNDYAPKTSGKLRPRKDRDQRRRNRTGLESLLVPICTGYGVPGGLGDNMLVPGSLAHAQMMLMPQTVIWDMPAVQPAYNNPYNMGANMGNIHEVETMLKQAMPECYED